MGSYIDDEERELIETIDADDYTPGKSLLTPELMEQLQQARKSTLDAEPAIVRNPAPR